MIKIDFEFDTAHGIFRDALYLPVDHTFTTEQIENMKTERVNNWIAVVTAPPSPQPSATVEIAGETYQKLEGVPPSGAKIVEVDGVWYFKV